MKFYGILRINPPSRVSRPNLLRSSSPSIPNEDPSELRSMADPLSITSGITALMGLCGNIIKLISTAKSASKNLRRIDIEVKAFSTVLEELKNDVLAGVEDATSLRSGVDAALEGCKTTLEEVTKSLEGLSISSSCQTGPGKRRKLNDTLKWTWRKGGTEALLTAIQQHKTTIMTGVLGECYREIKEIKKTVTAVHESLNDQDRSRVVSWIQQDVNPTTIHNKACDQRREEDNTGEWMLRMDKWQTWINSATQPAFRSLWVHGIPGAGKTIFASFLIDQCLDTIKDTPLKAAQCVYYYCSYRHDRDESEPFLRWVVSQLCRTLRLVPSKILELHDMNHHPSIQVLMDGLAELLVSLDVFYVVVDGVDESKEPRDQFLDILVRLATSPQFDKIRLLVTSRLYANIRTQFESCSMTVPMSNEEVDKDIRKFVTREITNTWKEPWRLSLKDKVVEKLVAGAQGMFQWAACQVRILNRKRSQQDIEQALEELPKDLDETYERMLREIPEEGRAVARDVFIWLHGHDGDVLGMVDESCDHDGLPATFLVRWINLHESSQISPSTEASYWRMADIEHICGCLITVSRVNSDTDHSDSDDPDSDSEDFVTFSHYTVLEYLLSDRVRERKDDVSFFALATEECRDDHIRQILTIIPSLDPCLAAIPGSEHGWEHGDNTDIFHEYCINVGMDAYWYAGATQIYDDLLVKINIPRLFRYLKHGDFTLVHWDGDPSTEDGVRLCDLVLNFWKKGEEDGLATRFLRENGSRDLFQNKIRGFGLTGYQRASISLEKFEEKVGWSQCFTESPLAMTGITLLLIKMTIRLIPIYVDKLAFRNLASFSLEYLDQATLLQTIIPLHFEGYTCCYSTQGEESCSLLTEVLNHRPGFDLNNTGYNVTPLQLAVYCWNLEMARSLIDEGADVNAMGLRNGKPLPESTIYQMPERWSQATPLHILRNADYGLREFQRRLNIIYAYLLGGKEDRNSEYPYDEDDRPNLEQLLLDNGAVDDDGTGVDQTAARRRLRQDLWV